VKLLIILLAIVGAGAGALHSYHSRNLYIQAALLAEAFNLTAHVKLRVADHYVKHGVMPHDNESAQLPPAKSIYGTSVKRVAINRGGVLLVDFDEEIGKQSMTFTPTVSPVSGLLSWHCTSDSIAEKVLVKLKPNCSYLPASLESQLMNAVANKDLLKVNQLLDQGVQQDAVVNGNTPLMLAAKIGRVDVVKRLLDNGAKVDNAALNSERRTPLMVAINSNNPEVVGVLLASGASVSRKDYKGLTALDHAVATDRRLGGERFVLMISASFNPQFAGSVQPIERKETPAERAAKMDALYGELRQAAKECHVQRLSSLLRAEHDLAVPELIDGKPLSRHVRKPACSATLTQFLASKSSYQRAVQARFSAVVQRCNAKQTEAMLREHVALDVMSTDGHSSHFQRAIVSGCTQVVSALLRNKRHAAELEDTVLISAINQAPTNSLVRLIGSLIAAGANVNAQTSDGQSPLAAAIALEHPVVAKYLVDAGANVNAPTMNGSYPLVEATKKGYEHLVLQLINNNAALDQRDALGRTALLAAVARGHHRLVDTLLRAGANRRIKDTNGIDALVLAESRNYRQIKTLLTASSE